MKLFFRQVLSSTQVHALASKLLLGTRNSSQRNTRLYAKFRVVWILLREIETGRDSNSSTLWTVLKETRICY